jgi:hypothetical protein
MTEHNQEIIGESRIVDHLTREIAGLIAAEMESFA